MRLLALLVVFVLAPRVSVSAQPVAPDSVSSSQAATEAQALDTQADSLQPPPELEPVTLQTVTADETEANPAQLPRWVWVLLGLAGLAGIGAGVWQILQRRREAPAVHRAGAPGQSAHLTNFDRTNRPGETAQPVQPEMVPKAALDAERERADGLQQQLAAMQAAPAAPAPPTEAAPFETPAVPDAPAGPGASDAVAEAFAAWCRTGGGLVDKHDLFARQIAGLGATLEVVRRDQDSPARPVYFDAGGGNAPAAHWLVRVGAEMLLLPQPQGPHQFRDLAPVFEGQAVPQSVQRVVPARVAVEGGGYVLTQPGRVA